MYFSYINFRSKATHSEDVYIYTLAISLPFVRTTLLSGADPEINERGGWLSFMLLLVFYMSTTI